MEVAWDVCNFRETCSPLTAARGRANVKVVYATPRLVLWKSSNEFPRFKKNGLACVCRGSYASSLNDRSLKYSFMSKCSNRRHVVQNNDFLGTVSHIVGLRFLQIFL